MLSTGLSNTSSYLLNSEEVFYAPHISLGFSRTDNINFTSEFGLEYSLKSNNSLDIMDLKSGLNVGPVIIKSSKSKKLIS